MIKFTDQDKKKYKKIIQDFMDSHGGRLPNYIIKGGSNILKVDYLKIFPEFAKTKPTPITPKPENKPFKWSKPIKNLKSNSLDFGANWIRDGKVHCGRDYNRKEAGEPVMAVAEGIVKYAEYSKEWDFGVCIEHKTPNGTYTSIYWHLEPIKVKKGQKVKAGQVIGVIGKLDKGQAFNVPHLHLGIRKGAYDGYLSLKGALKKADFPNGFQDPDKLFK